MAVFYKLETMDFGMKTESLQGKNRIPKVCKPCKSVIGDTIHRFIKVRVLLMFESLVKHCSSTWNPIHLSYMMFLFNYNEHTVESCFLEIQGIL